MAGRGEVAGQIVLSEGWHARARARSPLACGGVWGDPGHGDGPLTGAWAQGAQGGGKVSKWGGEAHHLVPAADAGHDETRERAQRGEQRVPGRELFVGLPGPRPRDGVAAE